MIPDFAARKRALTDFEANLMVEAAAGTGKTSLMAGRVAMMLAKGIDPSRIAAITFTELAASELENKIRWTLVELLSKRVPPALTGVIALPFEPEMLVHLAAAAPRISEITATTIHSFCQGIIQSHGLEAGLDPGSRVVDETVANAMFDEVLDRWLQARLTNDDSDEDPIAVLSKDDPLKIIAHVRELAYLRRTHQEAVAPWPHDDGRLDLVFADAVEEFARWHSSSPGDSWTAALIGDLQRVSTFLAGSFEECHGFAALWRFAHPPRIDIMRRRSIDFLPYNRMSAWQGAFGREEGSRLGHEAAQYFRAVATAYRALIGAIAQRLIASLSEALDEVLVAYDRRKREAAVLDFDDLLRLARQLVCGHPHIRASVSARFERLLVDEFQDTDRLQAEIIFCLAAESAPAVWHEAVLRKGGLFLVGDPKQAIYRFRGADIEAYRLAKAVIARPGNGEVIEVTANFRSRKDILDHVNIIFRDVLNKPGQPGFVPMSSTLSPSPLEVSSAVKLTITVPRDASAEDQREAEAAAVAVLCQRLIGALRIAEAGKGERLLRAGDIALLAPTHTDLWRYERALEAQGISVASQAGQALFRRQELQDILALVRALAEPLDTLAFGALMRGPLVGLTEEELLDITVALPPDGEGRQRFQLRTSADKVGHALARDILEKLQGLHKLAAETTPMQLLAFAIERLNLRVVMAARHRNRNARALANLDAIIELARPYGVAGLRAFALDLQRCWEERRRRPEGRVDASEDSVELVTMHSAKGLEWPVVIPINSSTRFKPADQFVHRQSDETLHWIIDGLEPPDLAAAREEEEEREAHQRERLWYVATTRAKDILVVPDLPGAPDRSWWRVMDLGQSRLPEIDLGVLREPATAHRATPENLQTEAIFIAEQDRVRVVSAPIAWDRPSDRDPDRTADVIDPFVIQAGDGTPLPVSGAGSLRGTILHKLMEEFLTSELSPHEDEVLDRVQILLGQLLSMLPEESGPHPAPEEMAETALRTLRLPELAPLLPTLTPEYSLWAANGAAYLAGRADAVALVDDRVMCVVDWKSDVMPSAASHAAHVTQLSEYLDVTAAPKGAIVYMTSGQVVWVERQFSHS